MTAAPIAASMTERPTTPQPTTANPITTGGT